jgi:hypothetical protein
MDQALLKLADSSPDILALLIIVFMFLKYMGMRDKLIKQLTDEHLAERALQRDIIQKNTVAAGVNTEALNNVAHILSETAKRQVQR